jgi:DNA-binding NtrC family response regulator
VAETLRARGYDVLEAEDGSTALAILIERPDAADVVLLDVRLPDSCDLRLLAQLRALAPSAAVIVMTAFGTRELANNARRLGAFRVISKPFELNELASLIRAAVTASRPN